MNIKTFIYNLFFKEERKSGSGKTAQPKSSEGKSSSSSSKRTAKRQKDGYDTSLLRQQVSETEYISNLRIGRSWILPQMVQMGFKKRTLSSNFDINLFETAIKKEYDASRTGRRKIWTLLKRNYKVIANSNGTSKRNRWWTKQVLQDMLEWDFGMVGKRNKGLNRSECIRILKSIEDMSDPVEIYKAVEEYDAYRMRARKVDANRGYCAKLPLPQSFINAYMGDGAYNAMMTMVKVLNIRISKGNRGSLSRDESIREIEQRSAVLSGRELLEYCKVTFFDSGVFDYKKYVN